MRYGSVDTMVAWLDREEVAAARERRMRRIVRRLSPNMRRFALALRRVLEDVPGPENLHREKIMKRLKIGRAMYFRMLQIVDKNLVLGAMGGGAMRLRRGAAATVAPLHIKPRKETPT